MNAYELAGAIYEGKDDEMRARYRRALRERACRRSVPYAIAIDFDGTLCESEWPGIGAPRADMLQKALIAKEAGCRLILWTCREGRRLEEALQWCADQGLSFDAVNDSLPEWQAKYRNNPRKIGCDELWDDKAVRM